MVAVDVSLSGLRKASWISCNSCFDCSYKFPTVGWLNIFGNIGHLLVECMQKYMSQKAICTIYLGYQITIIMYRQKTQSVL